MKTYVVGGAVRDELLGLPIKDRDHVVVGATPEDMARLGFRPVGRDFPVFLHPQTHEEHALARTERKTGRGYRGFVVHAAPDVTLEEDLARRDLTINAMARDADGTLIDPHGGARDLQAGVLRHVGAAFVEDPVRILRVARFAARFDFAVAPETMELMRRMVAEGEADALVPERVWQEFSRGLMEPRPGRMLEVLRDCGLMTRLLPELDLAYRAVAGTLAPDNAATRRLMGALGHAADAARPLEVRFALLAFSMRRREEADAVALCERLRAPNDCRDALLLALRHGEALRAVSAATDPQQLLALIEAGDALRRPERLRLLLAACESADWGDRGRVDRPYAPQVLMERLLQAASSVDAAGIAAQAAGQAGADVGARIREARLQAVRAALTDLGP